jgi:hypothetical protein
MNIHELHFVSRAVGELSEKGVARVDADICGQFPDVLVEFTHTKANSRFTPQKSPFNCAVEEKVLTHLTVASKPLLAFSGMNQWTEQSRCGVNFSTCRPTPSDLFFFD